MNTNRIRLREQGYSADESGHIICRRDGSFRDTRWQHERTAVLRIESADTKIIDALIVTVDEPRALVGRNRAGVVMLFRCETHVTPVAHPLVTSDLEPIAISAGSAGQSVDVSAYKWQKSPLDTPRDALPPLFDDHVEAAVKAAYGADCGAEADMRAERAREAKYAQMAADIKSGKLVLETDEQREARRDADIVERHKHVEIGVWDFDLRGVLAARERHAARQPKPEKKPRWWSAA